MIPLTRPVQAVAILGGKAHMDAMEQEIIKPEAEPASREQSFSTTGGLIAATGATLLMFCMTGAAMLATLWAVSKLFGFPDMMMYALMALGPCRCCGSRHGLRAVPGTSSSLLAEHQDIDVPVFKLSHYFRKA